MARYRRGEVRNVSLDRLIRIDILVIDELGYLNLRPEQSNIFGVVPSAVDLL